ncbi:hypothetical protein RLIN73S_04986 [Rhodanobacter lindaniclasticus]
MSKGMDSKKAEKKKPAKTLKEKRAAKQEEERTSSRSRPASGPAIPPERGRTGSRGAAPPA